MSREKKRCQAHPIKYKLGGSPQLEFWNAAYQDNLPVAKLVLHKLKKTGNNTQLGCGEGTVKIKGDLTEPLIPAEHWDMLGKWSYYWTKTRFTLHYSPK